MTLLDDARRLSVGPPPLEKFDGEVCHYCRHLMVEIVDNEGNFLKPQPHHPDCPWLAMPKIVAVLEAAERMVQEVGDPVTPVEEFGVTEIPDRLYRPLVAALRGEDVLT